ncbi:hypothetical protein NKH09_23835 [Mesorhizobium sp. M1339]|uniref:hypothetical protein n=1 Tax=unclassified Mesorhizobium TaxID=325217 RepID=UPI00333D42E0
MKTDMSAYGATELTPEEASATSGGWLIWLAGGLISAFFTGVISIVIKDIVYKLKHHIPINGD